MRREQKKDTSPAASTWFMDAVNAFKNTILAPEIEDIMPGVINASTVSNVASVSKLKKV